MFKGFNIKLPVYSVVCPQSGYLFDTRSLTVAELNYVKTSLTVPAKAYSIINKALWDTISDKPDFINNYEEFKKNVTMKDREALIYASYVATFGEDREFSTQCTTCGSENELNINIPGCFSMNAYPGSNSIISSYNVSKAIDKEEFDPEIENEMNKRGRNKKNKVKPEIGTPGIPDIAFVDEEDSISVDEAPEENNLNNILNKRLKIELPISKIIAIIKQPTIFDEEYIMKSIPFSQKKSLDAISETLIIDKFEEYDQNNGALKQVVDNREDILFAFQSLPPRDKMKMFDEYSENFGKYGIELKQDFNCKECGATNSLEIDIFNQFFRLVREY
jgi:hypothetical protein